MRVPLIEKRNQPVSVTRTDQSLAQRLWAWAIARPATKSSIPLR